MFEINSAALNIILEVVPQGDSPLGERCAMPELISYIAMKLHHKIA
jgi:hypothetical protein